MAEQRKRWLAVVVLGIVAFAFAGISVIVPFTSAFQNQSRNADSSPSASASPTQDLEAQAKGYQLVLDREPENQTALRGLVDTRIAQGKIDAIIEPLEKLAKLNPDQPDYTILLAQAKQRTGDREGAAQAYRDLLAKQPGSIGALKGLSDLLLEQQRPEAAIGLLQDTLNKADEANQAKPGSVDTAAVQLLLAEVYAVEGRYDEALARYDQLAKANAQDFRPILGKAIVLRTQGKNDEAAPLFVSAAALAPPQFKDQINQLAAAPSPTASPAASPTGDPATSPESSPAASPAPSPAASP